MNKNANHPPLREAYTAKYNSARMNLLLVLAMTLVNVVILACGSDRYFLFSATIPYFLVTLGMLWTGKMPDEYYIDWPETMPFLNSVVLVIMIVLAAIILGIYLCCFIFSNKNRVGWMLTAAIFFGIDTLGMILITGIGVDSLIDVLFHGWVLYYLISGTINGFRIKNLPEYEPEAANGEAIEVLYVDLTAPAAPIDDAAKADAPAEETAKEDNKES